MKRFFTLLFVIMLCLTMPVAAMAVPAGSVLTDAFGAAASPPTVDTSGPSFLGVNFSMWLTVFGLIFTGVLALLTSLVWKNSADAKKGEMLWWMQRAYYVVSEVSTKTPTVVDDLVAAVLGKGLEVLKASLPASTVAELNTKELLGLATLKANGVPLTADNVAKARFEWRSMSGAEKEEAKTRAKAASLVIVNNVAEPATTPAVPRGLSGAPVRP